MWCLLLFDVLAYEGDRRTPTASREVAGRPESRTPEFFANAGVILLPNHSTRNTLQTVYQG